MPSTTASLPIPELLARFLAARRPVLTARTARAYDDLAGLLAELLRERRITAVPCDPAFTVDPAGAASLGQLHREQRAAIDAVVELWDDAFDRYLLAAGVTRDYQRIAGAMLRDLGRWLRTTRLAPSEAPRAPSRRRTPHASSPRPRAAARARPLAVVPGAPAEAQA